MIRLVLLAAVLAVSQLASPSSAQVSSEGPWCALRNFGSDLSEDCQYRTFEECRVTVIAGFRGFCNPNPRWPVEPANPRSRRKG